jgi:hypothetical protein
MRRYRSRLFVVLTMLLRISLSAQVSDEAKSIQSHVLGEDS